MPSAVDLKTASYRFIVHGRVQGVGYRVFAQRQAVALGLCGWVRNRADGTVEGVAQGPVAALADFETRLRQGPPLGVVSGLDWQALPVDPGLQGFAIWRD